VVVSGGAGWINDVAQGLEAAGCRVVRAPGPEPGRKMLAFSPDQIQEYLSDADAFVTILREDYSREVLEACTKLKIGCSAIIGTENIDVEAATDLGIVIGWGAIPENYDGVAEAIVMLAAALVKRLPSKWEAVRSGGWRVEDAGQMVAKRTLGMVGLGNIGRGVARRLAGWEMELLAADPYVSQEDAAAHGVKLVDLDTLMRESDIVSVQVVLTAETRGMIGEEELSLMKPSAYLINTSRGPVVDEVALTRALNEDRLAGAALDVWADEPTSLDNPLRTHARVIATGHNLGHSIEGYQGLARAAVDNTLRGLRGEEPLYIRNPKVLPAWRERLARLGMAAVST